MRRFRTRHRETVRAPRVPYAHALDQLSLALSICVVIKNRSRVRANGHVLELFPRSVRSIVDSVKNIDGGVELVVSDYRSDDWPLAEWLPDAVGSLPLTIQRPTGTFSRGRGLNTAAAAAKGRALFFLDTDMIVSPQLFERALEVTATGATYFPVCWSYRDSGHTEGWWRTSGRGNCAVPNQVFRMVHGWPEYNRWGAEDCALHKTIARSFRVVRENAPDFFHQWHPDDYDWKNRYAGMT